MPWMDESALMARAVPEGTPRLVSWWWRALFVGGTIGLVPLLAVLWHFGDEPIGAFLDAIWPHAFRWLGSVFSPLGWMLAVALLAVWRASTQRPTEAAAWWSALMPMVAAWALCGVFEVLGAIVAWTVPAERAAAWSHLSPSPACGVPVALACALWSAHSAVRWPMTALAALALLAEVADGVAYASDALAGAWCGVAAAAALPLALWLRARDRTGPLRP